MDANHIIDRAGQLLQDTDHVRWTEPELLMWIGDAMLQIVSIRPDAHVTEAPMTLVAGADQTIPDTITVGTAPNEKTYTVAKLLDVKHNIKTNGQAGKAVTITDSNAVARFDKLWKTRQKKKEVDHWMHDNRFPKRFLTQPPTNGESEIMCEFATIPLRPEAGTDELGIHPRWQDAVLSYVMFRCYAKDAEHTARAGEYATLFSSLMQVDNQASRAYSPQIAEDGGKPNMNLLGQGGV